MTPTLRHTRGPWTHDGEFIVAPDPGGKHPDIYIAQIAETDDGGRVASIDEQEANARLISFAPELLAVVYRFAYSGTPLGQSIDDARNLLATIFGEGEL